MVYYLCVHSCNVPTSILNCSPSDQRQLHGSYTGVSYYFRIGSAMKSIRCRSRVLYGSGSRPPRYAYVSLREYTSYSVEHSEATLLTFVGFCFQPHHMIEFVYNDIVAIHDCYYTVCDIIHRVETPTECPCTY